MLVRILYVSRSVGPQTSTVTARILATAQAQNRLNGITGVLCQGQGLYLQVLEGERAAVHRLYGRLHVDRRHHDLQMLQLEEVNRRRFPDWSMAHISLHDNDPMVRLQHPEFDPYSAPGELVARMLDDLVAEGTRLNAPVP
jgi:hypothetical protein